MRNPVCISTGTVYRLTDDRNEMIKLLKDFSPDGIELSFSRPEYLLDFEIKDDNLEYIRSLKFNSIHAPWKEIVYGNNDLCKKVLKKIEKLYKQINARNITIHLKTDSNISALKDFGLPISAENGEWKTENWPNTPDGIALIFNQEKKLLFTFDFAHALAISPADIPQYFKRFKEKISEIHFSIRRKEDPDHSFLHKFDSPNIRNLLEPYNALDIPVVLECVASDKNELPLIGEEMNYAKEIFGTEK